MSVHPAPARRTLSAGFALAIALLAVPVAARADTPFVTETVDAAGTVGTQNSLALDAWGMAHISYLDAGVNDLKYAEQSSTGWKVETVDATGLTGWFGSLALDPAGQPHISYFDVTNGDLKYASRSGGLWTIETVDAIGTVGQYTSLAIDARGVPHISYHDVTNGDLKHASRSASTWVLETVDATGVVGTFSSIALDAQGGPRIAYLDVTNGHPKLASKTGAAWTLETVDAAGSTGQYLSLALDAQGDPRLSYYDVTNSDLKYAAKNGAVWTTETVDATGIVGWFTSLALDTQGNPRITSYDLTNGDLRYASKSGSVWTLETIDVAGVVGTYSSLALDAQGNPKLSYTDETNGDLRFTDSAVHVLSPSGAELWPAGSQQVVRWSGAGTVSVQLSGDGGATYSTLASSASGGSTVVSVPMWTTADARVRLTRSSPVSVSESPGTFSIAPGLVAPWWSVVVDPTVFGSAVSLALDRQGRAGISYFDATNSDLRYAARSGAGWTVETVDAAGTVGQASALAIDAQGDPRIAYSDVTNGHLKYASRAGGAWTIETADASINVGGQLSLALDPQGNPHIAYADGGLGRLKHASKSGVTWTLEVVDASPGGAGSYPSIAIDPEGNPRISYLAGSTVLKYAAKSNGGWTLETVAATGFFDPTSLALDGHGDPYVGYFDYNSSRLMLAHKSSGPWFVEPVDAVGGATASLALDPQGSPALAYITNSLSTGLYFARRTGHGWSHEILDTRGAALGAAPSLVFDADGEPRVAFIDGGTGRLRYGSAAVELIDPAPGGSWPVGAARTVTWAGNGLVDLALSTDGGGTWSTLATGLSGGSASMLVPHTPGRFAQLRLERAVPWSRSATPGLFTIQTSVALLALVASPAPAGGAELAWNSDPGPADLAGYRIERTGNADATWRTVAPLVKATRYTDADGAPGNRYRIFAVNGLGEEVLLGETQLAPARALAAWPSPVRSGQPLSLSFATASGLGGGAARAEVELLDVAGRQVAMLARGSYAAGVHMATWDGRGADGRALPAGLYFVRSRTAGRVAQLKLVVMP